MVSETLINYFIPGRLQNRFLAEFDKVRIITIGMITAAVLLFVLPWPLLAFFPLSRAYFIIGAFCLGTLIFIKRTGRYMFPTILTFVTAYLVLFYVISKSGGIFSIHIPTLYLLMLTGFCIERRIGHWMILVNGIVLVAVYLLTREHYGSGLTYHSKEYALAFNNCLMIFFGVFFSQVQKTHDLARKQIREKQLSEIASLNKTIRERTSQITSIRQNIACDFHDETGNILAAINQQANLLKMRFSGGHQLLPILENITTNCEQLYNSSRDFLWSINNENDNPMELFAHLTAFGQRFYNSFEIAFSSKPLHKEFHSVLKIAPFVNRDLICFFKEAMTNVVKHSGATAVDLTMMLRNGNITISLIDNGRWKPVDTKRPHYGLSNMEKRSKKGRFRYRIQSSEGGTTVEAEVTVSINVPSHLTDISELRLNNRETDYNY